MASRRQLKKAVNRIADITTMACLLGASECKAEKREEYGDVFLKIGQLRTDIISRISHTEPGSVKPFYSKLKADFDKGIEEIFAKIDELGK